MQEKSKKNDSNLKNILTYVISANLNDIIQNGQYDISYYLCTRKNKNETKTRFMKRFYVFFAACLFAVLAWAQGVKPLPTLHVEGKWLADQEGNHVVLHGVMDTPNMYFNGWRWGSPWDGTGTNYDSSGATKCKNYFEKLFTGLEKAKCNIFRLHLDPAWTNDPNNSYVYPGAADQPEDATSEADISKFNPTRLKSFLRLLYWPLMQKAMNHGMYVVVRPPGVCPKNLKVGDYYQKYLMAVWDTVSRNDNIKKYAGQISIELANEPVNLRNSDGQDDAKALHDYFQPIVDKIRANGFTGIIWVPGTGYQSNYRNYATYPIEGYNIGYAVHDYPGWYNSSDDNPGVENKRKSFHDAVPVIDTNPVFISEVDWSPIKEPKEFDKLNEHGDSVFKNLGTWATGSTSKWGKAFKEGVLDYFGNVSMTLTHPHDFFDIDKVVANGTVVAAFDENPEACGKACMDWYADYYNVDWPHADIMVYGDDMLTVEKLEVANEDMEVMIGNSNTLPLTATYRYGHTGIVSSKSDYEISNDVIEIKDGQVKGLKEGVANVTAAYTDPLNNTKTTDFTVRSTFFPFSAQYIKTDLFAQGTYNETTHTFSPGQWGQMGWVYNSGADMSGYKYLVIKLKTTSSGSHLNLFTENSIWSSCCSTPDFGTSRQIVLNLKTAKYTSGNNSGQSLDTKNIRIVSFWGTGSQNIIVNDMYLTNNSDYSPEGTTGITVVDSDSEDGQIVDVWSLTGHPIRKAVNIEQATQGLAPGIYIVGTKKVVVE